MVAYVQADRAGVNRLWVCDVQDGVSRQVTEQPVALEMNEGTDRRDVWGGPQWHPKEHRLIFVSKATWAGGQMSLWSVGLDEKPAIELTRHNGRDSTPRYSPDGRRIAFVCHRNGRDDLQLIASQGGVAMQLTYDRWDNTDIDWSPDGERLVYISQRSDVDLFSNNICVVSAGGGPTKALTEGGFANERSPRWSPDGKRIAFVSNRNDDDDIWCVNDDGTGLRALTLGNGEKADPRWSPDGRWLAYTHYAGGDIEVRVISSAGGPPRIVAAGGCNTAPRWSPDGTRLLYLRSDCGRPADLWCKSVESSASDPGRRLTSCAGNRLGDMTFSRPQLITYRSRDGLEIEGLLYRRCEKEHAAGPGVVYVHGGPNSVHANGWHPLHQYLAQRGFTLFAPNYRGSTGYGKAFMEANIGNRTDGDLMDWVNAADVLRALPEVDPERIAIMGRSAGGYATLLALGQVPDVFQAGVAIAAPSSWFIYWDETEIPWTRRFRMKLMGLPIANMELYRQRSPITYAADYKSPVLILHGALDPGVPSGQAREMAAELKRLGKKHTCVIYDGEGHQATGADAIVDSVSRIEAFLAEHLRPKSRFLERGES